MVIVHKQIKCLIAIILLNTIHISFLHARRSAASSKTARKVVNKAVPQKKSPVKATAPSKAIKQGPQKRPLKTTVGSKKAVVQQPQPAAQLSVHKDFELLVKQSNIFDATIGKFPTKDNRIAEIAGNDVRIQQKIVEQARNTYLLMHEDVRVFSDKFLQLKKQQGTDKEKELYASMNVDQLTMRFLEQRPLMFMTQADRWLLRSDHKQGFGGFEKIGTDNEQSPLVIKDYLSYDEMCVAALIGLSCPTYFINNGARNNKSIKMRHELFEAQGIYAGLVGARFEKPGYMEWQHMIITPQQNTAQNGYGLTASDGGLLGLWSDLYGEKFPTFNEAQQDTSGRFVLLKNGFYCDTTVYKKRIRLVIEPFLRDAHKRAMDENKLAYVHVVGLGLGVWQIDPRQAQWMLEAYADSIDDNNLSAISDIDFSWFPAPAQKIAGAVNGGQLKNITVHFSKRNPADKLEGNDSGKLLVAMYAWDGNAYPGNEYWASMLEASGDPAAACCSTIAELQNPKINPFIKENIKKLPAYVMSSKKQLKTNVKKAVAAPQQLSWWERIKRSISLN